jgi:hypothetical protein
MQLSRCDTNSVTTRLRGSSHLWPVSTCRRRGVEIPLGSRRHTLQIPLRLANPRCRLRDQGVHRGHVEAALRRGREYHEPGGSHPVPRCYRIQHGALCAARVPTVKIRHSCSGMYTEPIHSGAKIATPVCNHGTELSVCEDVPLVVCQGVLSPRYHSAGCRQPKDSLCNPHTRELVFYDIASKSLPLKTHTSYQVRAPDKRRGDEPKQISGPDNQR